ncbi:iron-sulfur cluster insertion protein ErpA [Halarchaeum rubridurum]|uniref:Iron-sulfur cluster insertion protein ErpA n=2 Tax=Halarchaeum rubridurum TaxID=489911 RepID=A0A830FSE8_9EURY|nr:iron-sulfur cluster insertion protein ErpA [Halarchaeum rubridurum]
MAHPDATVNHLGDVATGMSTTADSGSPSETVRVTEDAAEQALSLLDGEGLDTDVAGLRLFVQQGGCAGLSYGMRFDDAPEEDDTIVESHGLRVFVDPASEQYIAGSELDYESGLQAAGFDVTNPNVEAECGCGESFRT